MPRERRDIIGLLGALLLAGCGPVSFVTSPYAPVALSLVYSEQEDLTVLRWKLGANADTGEVDFEIFRDGQWGPLDFDSTPFPAGEYGCAKARCFLFSMRGRYEPPEDGVLLRSRHAHHGLLTAAPVGVETLTTSLSFAPRFRPGNTVLALGIDDALSPENTSLRRRFRWTLRESESACAASTPFDGVTEGVESVPYRGQPTDLGRYCVTLEVVADDGGPVTRLVSQAFTHPLLELRSHEYLEPHEKAPVYVQLIVDLEIPNEERCLATVAKIQERLKPLLRHGPGGGHAFEPEWLALSDGVRCRQNPAAELDVPGIVERVRSHVNRNAPGAHGASLLFVYVSNLALPMSERLGGALFSLIEAFASDPKASASVWAFSAMPALPGEGAFFTTSWTSPFDKAFEDLVKSYDEMRFPVRSSLHDPRKSIELASTASVGGAGVLFKHCSSTPSVQLMRGEELLPSEVVTSPVSAGEPIGFRADFSPLVRVDAILWTERKVSTRYELCRRWCAHPFESSSGAVLGAWTTEKRCREAP